MRKVAQGAFEENLHLIVQEKRESAQEYLENDASFSFFQPNLFGRIEFGYGACGFVTSQDTEVSLHIELSNQRFIHEYALTINVLAWALQLPTEGVPPSNQTQQSRLAAWLCKQGMQVSEGQYNVSMPRPVILAMQQVWRALSRDKNQAKYAQACRGSILDDGRFMLTCFGDACDIAIYPDCIYPGWENAPTRFGCHNLDSAIQQLTLLAGLAKMCELARKDEE